MRRGRTLLVAFDISTFIRVYPWRGGLCADTLRFICLKCYLIFFADVTWPRLARAMGGVARFRWFFCTA